MEGIIRVEPAKLKSTSSEFSSSASKVQGITNQMMSKVTGLANMWEGEASNAYLTKFKALQTDMDKLFKMIQDHSQNLQDMATEYETSEQKNEELAQSLATDVIQ